MKKKLMSLVLAMTMILSALPAAFAAEGESPLPNSIQVETALILEGNYVIDSTGTAIITRTTELSSPRSSAGERRFAQEVVAIIPASEVEANTLENEIMQIKSVQGGSSSKYSSLSGAIILYSTVYYRLEIEDWATSYVELEKVEGHWERSVDSVAIQSQEVTCQQVDNGTAYNQIAHYYPSVLPQNWTVVPPSNWTNINNIQLVDQGFGATYTATCIANSGDVFTIMLKNYPTMPITY